MVWTREVTLVVSAKTSNQARRGTQTRGPARLVIRLRARGLVGIVTFSSSGVRCLAADPYCTWLYDVLYRREMDSRTQLLLFVWCGHALLFIATCSREIDRQACIRLFL